MLQIWWPRANAPVHLSEGGGGGDCEDVDVLNKVLDVAVGKVGTGQR